MQEHGSARCHTHNPSLRCVISTPDFESQAALMYPNVSSPRCFKTAGILGKETLFLFIPYLIWLLSPGMFQRKETGLFVFTWPSSLSAEITCEDTEIPSALQRFQASKVEDRVQRASRLNSVQHRHFVPGTEIRNERLG